MRADRLVTIPLVATLGLLALLVAAAPLPAQATKAAKTPKAAKAPKAPPAPADRIVDPVPARDCRITSRAIFDLQRALRDLGFDRARRLDSTYDATTYAALQRYRRSGKSDPRVESAAGWLYLRARKCPPPKAKR